MERFKVKGISIDSIALQGLKNRNVSHYFGEFDKYCKKECDINTLHGQQFNPSHISALSK
jgi:hypothetical protein